MKVWVTRDNGKHNSCVTVWENSKPVINSDGLFYPDYTKDSGMHEQMVVEGATKFKSLFGFTPRKGSCKQYELTLKEIK